MRHWLGLCFLLAACGGESGRCPVDGDLPDQWTLTGTDIQVVVDRSPFGFQVRDRSDQVVLSSLPGGDADGFAALAWTSGLAGYDDFLTPGYTGFFPTLDPWRDRFEVVQATDEGDALVLVLAAPDGGDDPCVQARLEVGAGHLSVSASTLDGTPRAWAAGFASPADEGFLGMGERFNRTDQRGVNVYSYAEEGGIGQGEGEPADDDNPYPFGEAMTYYPVPFFLSTAGYGFWLDTTWRSEMNFATLRADAWRAWHVGPTMAYRVMVPRAADSGPWPYSVIGQFAAATGLPRLLPEWALGPRRRINRGDMQEGVPEIQRMRDLDLAITAADDAMHFYPSAGHLGDEAAIAAWIDSAEALGYRVNGYYNSMINQDPASPIAAWAAEGEAAGHYLRRENGTYPDIWVLTGGETPHMYLVDFTSAAATDWYRQSFAWARDLGYAGWMYDFGEYVTWDVVASNGMSGEELHNLYPVLYAQAFDGGADELAFMRSGYTGSSHFVPAAWSGDPAASFEDSDGLPSMVRAGVNIGISAVPFWGGDIGGFHCLRDGTAGADAELVTRWIQMGSMTPIMMDQDACVGGDSSLKASIWNSPEAMAAWAEYARLHTRLFPYLLALAWQAADRGAPLMRHLFLEHPDRIDLRAVDDAYYFGPALLVAPVVERGATSRELALPDGLYLDWHDHTLVTGGQQITLDAPLDRLPLLLRANHLVPMLDPTIDTLAEESSPEVIGRADLGDVYDVVALLVEGEADQVLLPTLTGVLTLDAQLAGPVTAPALTVAGSEAELATCDGCYLLEALPGGLQRLRVSTGADTVTAGGLQLFGGGGGVRVRWDVFIAP